tara:strand:+ start:6174 stop:6860 length:687 start_codon:yes stop_codon:yes gene_type:complete
MANKIKDRVLAKLAEDEDTFVSDIVNEQDLFEQAVWEVASMLPTRMLVNVAADPSSPTTSPHALIVHERVLLVLRDDNDAASGGNLIQCEEIGIEDSWRVLDTGSIHFATKTTPVFWVHRKSGASSPEVTVAPDSDHLTVYTYKRQTVGDGNGELDWDTATGIDNIPDEALEAIILRTAEMIMQQKLSKMAVDEEDAEIFAIYKANLDQLTSSFRDELTLLKKEEIKK